MAFTWLTRHIGELPRQDHFPLRVECVFYCSNSLFPFTGETRVCKYTEVCLRLDSAAPVCTDLVDGVPMKVAFPHVIIKRPGMKIALAGNKPRDVLAFYYLDKEAELLKQWGMLPNEIFWPIRLNGPLQQLISEFRAILCSYTLPGMPDKLDWTALQIAREVLFQRQETGHAMNPAARLQEAALYLQHHYNQELTCDEVAARFGFSHAAFFREWKLQFDLSPKDYILNFRLKTAARRLIETNLPVSAIVKEVRFSGLTAFHRKFTDLFGATPGEFRSDPELWKKEFPDLELE